MIRVLSMATSLLRRLARAELAARDFSHSPLAFTSDERAVSDVLRRIREEVSPAEDVGILRTEATRARLASLGLFGTAIPSGFGGSGLSRTGSARMFEALGRTDASAAALLCAHTFASQALLASGQDGLRDAWLPKASSGAALLAFALTEKDTGSDLSAPQSYAIRQPDGYLLSGQKTWVTGGEIADAVVLLSRTASEDEGARPLTSAFLVPKSAPVEISDAGDQLALHGARTCTMTWHQAHIPAGSMLGARGDGRRVALRGMSEGRVYVSAACLGIAKRIVDLMVERAGSRRSFGRTVGELGMVRDRVASALALTYALESVVYATSGAPGLPGDADSALDSTACKIMAADTLLRLTTLSFTLASGDAYRTTSDFGAVYREAMGYLSIGGPVDVLRSSLGISLIESANPVVAKGLNAQLVARVESLAGGLWRKALPSDVDDEFTQEEAHLRDLCATFAEATALASERYGKDIVEVQFVQRRVARSAVALYAAIACVARARHAARTHGKQGSLRERDLTRIYVRGAIAEIRAELHSLNDNDDELRKSVAVKAYNDRGYALDLV